jgi:small conductance mechanosensitive channel
MHETSTARLLLILGVAIGSHLIALSARWLSRAALGSRIGSTTKLLTITGFATSSLIFGVYFAAIGFVLHELGVSLTTYLASASVIGLAVSFGSQGVVQDVITGITVVFSDLLDVGDMVDISGQIGIVERVHMRFTVLINFSGARVYIPNRSIANVINYPQGFVRAFLDIRLPDDQARWAETETRVSELTHAAYQQFPGILFLPPHFEGRHETSAGGAYLRFKFRLWPGQGTLLEQTVKPTIVAALKKIDDGYSDWMVTVHYRAEPPGDDHSKRLPRPSALRSVPVAGWRAKRSS